MSEGFSITPPLSPYDWPENEDMVIGLDQSLQVPELSDTTLMHFSCLGEVGPETRKKFHPEGYLQGGELYRLLINEIVGPQNLASDIIQLFDCHFLTESALSEECDKLFYLARQQIVVLEKGVENQIFCRNSESNEYFIARNNVCNFLNHIKIYVHRMLSFKETDEEKVEIVKEISLQLKHFLLYIGHLSNLSFVAGSKTNAGHKASSAAFHLCHLYLDILWCAASVFVIYKKNLSLLEGVSSKMSELGEFIISEFMLLALRRFEQDFSESEIFSKSPFSCTCIQEFWVLLMHVFEAFESDLEVDSFWVCLCKVMQFFQNEEEKSADLEMDCDHWVLPSIPLSKNCNRLGFSWWIMVHLVPLAHCNSLGNFQNDYRLVKGKPKSFLLVAEYLLKLSLNPHNAEFEAEIHQRLYLRALLFLEQFFEPDINILVILWEHFHKKLNEKFAISSHTLDGLTYLSKSAGDWFDHVNGIQNRNTDSCCTDSSFLVFLKILRFSLEQLTKNGQIQEWKQMKGRFYSKFHQRRMQGLTETGLHNFFNLFLTLATIADLEDVTSKLLDLLDLLEVDNLSSSKTKVIWRGLLTLLLVYENRQADITFPATKLLSGFNKKVRDFSISEGDQHYQLWSLLTVYLEGCQDIFEMSRHLNLSESILLGDGFKIMLSKSKDHELQMALVVIENILSQYRNVLKSFTNNNDNSCVTLHHQAIADHLWVHIFPVIKEHAFNESLAFSLGDAAANFTLLACIKPPSLSQGVRENFLSLFKHFAAGDNVNAKLSCRYLCHMVSNHQVMNQLMVDYSKPDTLLIPSWIRCSLLLPSSDSQLQELTRLIFKLPSVEDLFARAGIEPFTNIDTAILQFIKALSVGGQSLQSWKEKMDYRAKVLDYLGSVARYISPALKPTSSVDLLRNIYNICGHLVKNCAELIYAKSKSDSLLPALIDRLVLPPTLIASDKNLVPSILEAIRDHLHLFVQGLSKLGLNKDPYIQRKLKEIMTHYFLRFPVKQMSSSLIIQSHPLIASLSESFTHQPPAHASELYQFCLIFIKDTHMNIRGNNLPTHIGLALSFICEVFQRTSLESEIARNCGVLLPVILDCCLICESPAAKKLTFEILHYLLESCKRTPDIIPRSELINHLQEFITKHLKLCSGRLFKILESISVMYRELTIDFIPIMSQILKDWEDTRGVGVDHLLRQQYKNWFNQLGIAGAEEVKKLNADNM